MLRKSHLFSAILIVVTALSLASETSSQQRRDYMTEQEIELVRDAQAIDERIDVLTAAIERRFAVLKVSTANPKPVKESEKWGPLPTGTRLELLDDIRRLIQKAIDDIDNTFERPPDPSSDKDRGGKVNKREAQRFPNAVRSLAASSQRYLPVFRNLLDQSGDEREKGVILDAIDSCEQIIDAASRLSSEAKSG